MHSITPLPPELNDGGRVYTLVRQRSLLEDGREDLAVYEPYPKDGKQYTPSLSTVLAIEKGEPHTPLMLAFSR
jgi:hypothetical protein